MTGRNRSARARRRSELAAIHAGRRALSLDDDAYRALLESCTGKRSSAELNAHERSIVLDCMRRAGFQRARPFTGKRTQAELIRDMWKALDSHGMLRDPSERGLNAFVERVSGKSRIEWCSPSELSRVIEQLKTWLRRAPDT